MKESHSKTKKYPKKESPSPATNSSETGSEGSSERRSGTDRRSGIGRRIHQQPRVGKERRSDEERRAGKDRRKKLRIPIFLKLAALSTLLIFLVIFTISFSILTRQKNQFINQLIDLGKSMVYIVASNAPDKLLGGEDLGLFQLLKDISQNDQVIFAFITDENNIIKAHSNIEETNREYSPPKNIISSQVTNGVKVSAFVQDGQEILFFEKTITYQKLKIGEVHLAISQKQILQNIHNAEIFILVLTVVIIFFGILLSLGFSVYFSRPIKKLRESTKALGMGDLSQRVNIKRNDELGDLGSTFNRMVEGLAEREMIRETFGKYVTPEIRDEILSGHIPLDGDRTVATVLFADLRSFTPYVEENPPEEVIKGMRAYFTAMQKVIRSNDGLVLQYVGDEIEAVFGVPLRYEDHAEKAVMAAIKMRKSLEVLNKGRTQKGLTPFRHGIGIHTGEVLAGNTGSEDRLSYALIGDTVNLGSRIQDLTKEFQCDILASEETVNMISRKFKLEKKSPHLLKGYSKPIIVYQVIS